MIKLDLSLQELLEKTKKEKNPFYTKEILRSKKVSTVINYVCRKFKVKRLQVELWIIEYTLKYYKLDDLYIEERFLNGIRKYTGRKAAEFSGKEKNKL